MIYQMFDYSTVDDVHREVSESCDRIKEELRDRADNGNDNKGADNEVKRSRRS